MILIRSSLHCAKVLTAHSSRNPLYALLLFIMSGKTNSIYIKENLQNMLYTTCVFMWRRKIKGAKGEDRGYMEWLSGMEE